MMVLFLLCSTASEAPSIFINLYYFTVLHKNSSKCFDALDSALSAEDNFPLSTQTQRPQQPSVGSARQKRRSLERPREENRTWPGRTSPTPVWKVGNYPRHKAEIIHWAEISMEHRATDTNRSHLELSKVDNCRGKVVVWHELKRWWWGSEERRPTEDNKIQKVIQTPE